MKRRPDRALYERAAVAAILDEAFVCHVGFVSEGSPVVIPMVHARVEDTLYLNEVAAELRDVDEVLIVGPSHSKWELKAYIERRAHDIAERIVGVETVNHPTEGQLLAYAQHYFVAVGRMRRH